VATASTPELALSLMEALEKRLKQPQGWTLLA